MLQFYVESFEKAIDMAETVKPILDEIYNDGITSVQLHYFDNSNKLYTWKDEETGIEDFYEWIEYCNDVL